MSIFKSLLLVAAALPLFGAWPAHAGLITIDGQDVSFTYDPSTFVVGPAVSGDNVEFSSNTIVATAGGSAPNGVLSTSSSVTFEIELTNPNDSFSTISLAEHGIYSLSGNNSSVSMAGSSMTISAVGSNASVTSSISPTSSLLQNDGNTHGWTATASDSLASGPLAGVREISVTLYNLLTASASPGSTAMIEAGFAGDAGNPDGLSVGVTSTPLPGSSTLLGSGLLLFALSGVVMRMRKRSNVDATRVPCVA